ncbi:DUF485 domain-containing protein [Streptomyces sp. PKU-EA00015]|uniref:DUF485 domain-containing protein n=1 Tax=Streptomyces sp. PKU-EA00015 TaxID=2748326 RepID=UPI0015A0ABF4|nr:DUF485 domain-containing protein [Streptomyces sp. PKU-EA00015]NWF29929.1 DUF485 domain-containing protein [Streptomyces sp. PKU-EA00015]
MSYHQLFPEPPPQPRAAGRHRHDAASHGWDDGPQPWADARQQQDPWDTAHQRPQQRWDAPRQQPEPDPAPDDRVDMRALGSAYRRLRRVATLTALGYFVLFLLLSGYAPETMTGRITGGLTTGLVLGLLQLPVALAAIAVYERIARRRVDPLAHAIRERAETAAADRTEHQSRPGRAAWQQPTGGTRA